MAESENTLTVNTQHPLVLAIKDMINADGGSNEKILKWLYDILTILDNKTAHLLRLNALLLTASTFLLKIVFDLEPSLSGRSRILLLLVLVVPLLGITFSLPIFRIAWRFLPWKQNPQRPNEAASLSAELEKLAQACETRTQNHENVWKVTIASLGAFSVILVAAICAAQ